MMMVQRPQSDSLGIETAAGCGKTLLDVHTSWELQALVLICLGSLLQRPKSSGEDALLQVTAG